MKRGITFVAINLAVFLTQHAFADAAASQQKKSSHQECSVETERHGRHRLRNRIRNHRLNHSRTHSHGRHHGSSRCAMGTYPTCPPSDAPACPPSDAPACPPSDAPACPPSYEPSSRYTLGGYWGSTWYDTCYSNSNVAGDHASQLRSAADAVAQDSYNTDEIRYQADRLSFSTNSLYEVLASCVNGEVGYQAFLDALDLVSVDYNVLMSSSGGADLSGIQRSYLDLVYALQESLDQ